MDIPPPSPTAPASSISPPPAPTTTNGSSSASDWYHALSQHIDMLNLDMRALSEEHDHRFGVLESQQAEILRILRSQFTPPY